MLMDQCQLIASYCGVSSSQQVIFASSIVLLGLLVITFGMWLFLYLITRENVQGKSVGIMDWLLAAVALLVSWLMLGVWVVKLAFVYVGLKLIAFAAARLGRPHFLPNITHRVVEAFRRLVW